MKRQGSNTGHNGFLLSATVLLFTDFLLAYPPPPCPPCYVWVSPNCVYQCKGCESCKNNVCVECGGVAGLACCDNKGCYSTSQQVCCGYGDGTACNKQTECCLDGGCRPRNCGGNCCRANQFCCGDLQEGVCCNAGEECCFYLAYPYSHYCVQPCRDEITDTESCSEMKDENERCPGCTPPFFSPQCWEFHWVDYTGLKIKECYEGCPQRDWNIRSEICYQRKFCTGTFQENQLCMLCQDELFCVPLLNSGPSGCDFSIGNCLLTVACNLLTGCVKCEPSSEVIDTYYRETCDCK